MFFSQSDHCNKQPQLLVFSASHNLQSLHYTFYKAYILCSCITQVTPASSAAIHAELKVQQPWGLTVKWCSWKHWSILKNFSKQFREHVFFGSRIFCVVKSRTKLVKHCSVVLCQFPSQSACWVSTSLWSRFPWLVHTKQSLVKMESLS